MTTNIAQWRDTEAQKLTLDLIDLGHIRKSEKVAGRLLAKACIRAEERTREVESQKKAYKETKYLFDSPLEMAIYIINELPHEWERCKGLKKAWQQAKGKKAKNDVVPSIDRIDEDKHYERGNVQILSNSENRAKSAKNKMKPRASFVVSKDEHGAVNVELKRFESITATEQGLNVSYAKAKKFSFHDSRAELEARNARFLSKSKQ